MQLCPSMYMSGKGGFYEGVEAGFDGFVVDGFDGDGEGVYLFLEGAFEDIRLCGGEVPLVDEVVGAPLGDLAEPVVLDGSLGYFLEFVHVNSL